MATPPAAEDHSSGAEATAGADDLTIVAPLFNEADLLDAFVQRIESSMQGLDLSWSLLLVDDGSSDQSWQRTCELSEQHAWIKGIRLSRNFGKEIAMTAGLAHVDGAAVVIDSDLQDPPELIPKMIELWRAGHDVIFARRSRRDGEGWFKRATAWLFYRLMQRTSRTPIPVDTGDFRLLSPAAVRALNKLPERNRFMKGLFAWIGYSQVAIDYDREPRAGGDSKFRWGRLLDFAVDGITSFSAAPLRIATFLGLAASVLAVAYGLVVIFKTLAFGEPVRGYPSLMVTVLFLGGVQLLALGVIGEYLARLFEETKGRPLYLIQETLKVKPRE